MNSRRLALPLVAFACLVVAPLAGAVSQTQTSWTGGPGVAGPVSTWGTSFSSSAYIEYTTYPGQLFLDQVILGTPVQHTVRTNLNSLRWTWGADIDMDGGQDLIAAVSGTDDIIWWENYDDSGDTWIDHLVDGSFDGACCVMAADIDDDGDTDLFGAASVADDVAWWRHDGSSWTKIQVEGSFDGAWTVYAADIDRDSDLDIVGAARNADDVCWFENIGGMGASWVEHTIDGSFDGASHVVCADVDSDGDKDVVCAAEFGDMISWWSNNGSGTSWSERVVATGFEGASCVQAVDMDGDGDID
ncbi:VCBS repeat-containing protein, partial [Candidatus Fermentibacterales bacterium]|nr:VCBS repeat-containing protein [Candidatus Fermentibacterales bacterium]